MRRGSARKRETRWSSARKVRRDEEEEGEESRCEEEDDEEERCEEVRGGAERVPRLDVTNPPSRGDSARSDRLAFLVKVDSDLLSGLVLLSSLAC